MTKYIVKTTSKATDSNPNFAGQTSIVYYGKGDHTLGMVGDHNRLNYNYKELNPYLVKEYGYSRECDAKKAYSYKNTIDNYGYWETTAEIISMEV